MSSESKKVVILGAGIAGISAGCQVQALGGTAQLYEAGPRAGGLLDNFSVEGFRFDQAVHLSFATEPEVRAVFDRTPYFSHSAESWCRDGDRWLKHPVQNNMHPLPIEERV